MVYIIELIDYRAVIASAALAVIGSAYGLGRYQAQTPKYSDHCSPSIESERICRSELDAIEQTSQAALFKAVSNAQANAMLLCEQEKTELEKQWQDLNCDICTAFIRGNK